MAQLHRNHEKGIFLEDPAVTMELLKDMTIQARQPPKTPRNPRDVTEIVDAVLNDCAAENRRRIEVEVHMTHEFRNCVIDVRRVFMQPTRRPTFHI
jgi:CRISPR/Cas system CSM-associated protein Csm5 (group 7 of RAMP superfamily)